MPVVTLTATEQVEQLVASINDPQRVTPVLVVTTRNGESEPLIDAAKLALAVAPVTVHLIPTGPLTWELTGLLPDQLGVFGGAARIWWPGYDQDPRPHRHPLVFAYSREEGPRAIERLVREIDQHVDVHLQKALAPAARVAPPIPLDHQPIDVGKVVPGRVTYATVGGVEVEVAPGWTGWLVLRRRDPQLQVGDETAVLIVGYDERGPLLEHPPRERTSTVPPPAVSPLTIAAGGPRPGPHLHKQTPTTGPTAKDATIIQPATVGATASAEAAQEIATLRRLLAEAEEDRREAEHQATRAQEEASRAIRDMSRRERDTKGQLKRARDRMQWLENQLRGSGRYDDAEQQFRHEIDVHWSQSHFGSDRTDWPLTSFTLGPDFLPSLEAVAGIPRSKIVEVCVAVLTGRAADLASRELHALRTDEGGDSPQRERGDGAKAWRVSLQIKTPSARRLHFWRLPDNSVELSKVGVHDDLSIT